MLSALSDPVIVVDDRTIITSANAAAGRLFGLPADDLVGRSCLDWVHEPDRVEGAERLTHLVSGEDVRATILRLADTSGRLRWIEVTGARFEVDGAVRAAISVRNIDGRLARELESARSISRAQLLSQLAVEFQTVTPGRFTESLTNALRRLGDAAGAVVAELHEVEPDGTTLVLRGRWASNRAASIERTIAPARLGLAEIPRLRTALNATTDVVEIRPGEPLAEDAGRLDPALEVAIAVPLCPVDDLVAVVTLGWPSAHVLTNDERDLAASAGRVLGTALERVRAQQALLESEAMFRDLFHGSSAVMYLVDPATLRLVDANQAAANFYGYSREAMTGMDLHRLTVHSKEDLAVLVEHLRADSATTVIDERQQLSDGRVRLVEIHSTPMRINNREFDLAIVQDVTEQRLAHEQLEVLASTDELTGAMNRRRFFEVVESLLDVSTSADLPVTMLMLDLDHFKAVNDEQGHAAGDRALLDFCDACRSALRPGDHFARLGGEEFAVVLAATEREGGLEIAEAIRSAVEDSGVTVSIGVAEWAPGMTLDALYARADKLLYEAKQAGRNRVVG